MAYKTGVNRSQINLFPICLDEGIAADNVVRVIDAFVDWLDLEELGFQHSTDNLRGTSMYPPGMLLKLYLYGYLNRIRSSRRLETECARNIELHWLLHRMAPAYHTIADFRKVNPDALKGAFRQFSQFCIAMSLIEGETIAFDGTKVRAQNNQKNNFNAARLEKLLGRIDVKTQEYGQYLKELDTQDAEEGKGQPAPLAAGRSKGDIEKTLALLNERRTKYAGFQERLKELAEAGGSTEDLQISTVDPDARSMPFKQKQTEVGYNVQTAGDAKHGLIAHFEVTNVNDTNALSALALDTKGALNLGPADTLTALADAGYHTGAELAKCAENGIVTYVCPTDIAAAQSKAKDGTQAFTKDQFTYDAQTDSYTCPNQQELKSNGTWYEHKATTKRKQPRRYKQYTLPSQTCQACPFAEKCQGVRHKQWHGKTIERTEHDDAVEANRKRLLARPQAYQQRKEIIEHPFGTIKRSWGYSYTLLRTKKKVGGEFALIFLCYNIRRAMTILGAKGLGDALKALFCVDMGLYKRFSAIIRYLPKMVPVYCLIHKGRLNAYKELYSPFFAKVDCKYLFCTV